jgi:hypothetical protein
MEVTMQNCTLILRHLTPGGGITETSLPITTLEELFTYCVTNVEPHLLERVLLAGQDAQGRERLLTFTFQSVTDHDQP